ncbi:MAG: biotin transporter BioY [Rhodoglobus sp.]|nr:biotin transporter BioY [Rhodoglobus sp.]
MTSIAQPAQGGTLLDAFIPRTAVVNIVSVVLGAGLVGALAQVSIPLWPVPITGQTLGVLVVASLLGLWRGVSAMVLYAAAGAAGLPWFSDASSGVSVILGPTGGYILGFIVAAALTGWLAQRNWDRKILGGIVAFLAGSVSVFALGLPWLAAVLGLTLEQTLEFGLYPFIIGGVIKAVVAAGLIRGGWEIAGRVKRRGDVD